MKKLLILIFAASCSSLSAGNPPLDVVQHVDLQKYLGKWYEVARFDQSFQKNCTATQAHYSMRSDGDIKVMNTCRLFTPDGELKVAEGRAWVKDKKSNAKLKVQFFLKAIKLSFLAGNYWILDLDQNYQYALIGDPSRKYLWILSRTKVMDEAIFQNLVKKAEELKFDTSKLLRTLH